MAFNVFQLSSLKTYQLSCSLDGLEFKQFEKTHNGGIPLYFTECFSDICDYKSKFYTDFVLTKNTKSSDIFNFKFPKLEVEKFLTTIQDRGLYLTCVGVEESYFKTALRSDEVPDYRGCLFSNSLSSSSLSTFTLDFFQKEKCKLSCQIDNENYYLIYNDDNLNDPYFVNERLLSTDDSLNQPHHFNYIYQENYNFITFFKETATGIYYLYRDNNKLKTSIITGFNKLNVIESVFKVSRNKYFNFDLSLNSTFVTYNNDDNKIDIAKSEFGLKNNFLIHKGNSIKNSKSNITVLKNHFLPHLEQISNTNNLLSGIKDQYDTIYVDNIRNYTSIFEDISMEKDEDLELNYVYHNKNYVIVPGKNEIPAPDNMFPFVQLNINDSKIREAGAFSFPSPDLADKVYYYDNDVQVTNNQHYLCTWLSGAVGSTNSIWVDRYYYPNRINKEDALNGKPIFSKTYDEYIEDYIESNSLVSDGVDNFKFFDKISDLIFKPNKKYIYERVSFTKEATQAITYCNTFISNKPSNYFKTINDSGKFTFILYFNGNNESWEVKTDRNEINAGITIIKTATNVTITYSLRATNKTGDLACRSYTKTVNFKQLKENAIYIGFDSYSGKGYFIFNEDTLLTFKEQSSRFTGRNIIFGDFFIYETDKITNEVKKINLLSYSGSNISDKFISDDFYSKDLVYSISISKGKYSIDPMYITLPCGMRNGSDNINLIHSICGNTSSKSNKSNVFVKNIDIENEEILNNLETELKSKINAVLPVSNDVNIILNKKYK